jgi:hypothetical protein
MGVEVTGSRTAAAEAAEPGKYCNACVRAQSIAFASTPETRTALLPCVRVASYPNSLGGAAYTPGEYVFASRYVEVMQHPLVPGAIENRLLLGFNPASGHFDKHKTIFT